VNLSLFQKPSRYINHELNAVHKEAPVKVALAFPDIYEIGMSHLGLRILYKIINDIPFASAERVFSPWIDLEAGMKANGSLLSSLESGRPLNKFDIAGFSLQYELSYTTVLNMLDLGGIPLKTKDRINSGDRYPLIIAGGPCTVNPMPMSPFIDAFLIGDGEEAVPEILEIYHQWKISGDADKESLLKALSGIEGIYVPILHSSENLDSSFVKRRFIASLDNAPYPDKPIVPYTSIVHDRINIEVSRGCPMGCRFCQAGMIYRPVRERSPQKALELAEKALKNTGYEEVSFTSLSAGDYSCLLQLTQEFNKRFAKDNISLSLPSLRVAAVNRDLIREIRTVRKTGFTIAPEAGTDRLRKVINKDFSDEDYENALTVLFDEGWLNLKLYFMVGLPTETDEDIDGIIDMALKALKTTRKYSKRRVNINIGVSPFVPKAHTPFQWYGQPPLEELKRKKNRIRGVLSKKGLNIKGHDPEMSLLEAAFARGDERLSHLIEKAWSLGCRLDGWSEVFDFKKWEQAMESVGVEAKDFAQRNYEESEHLPWDGIDMGVTKEFLWREFRKALTGELSSDCRKVCHNCGLSCDKDRGKGKSEEAQTFVPDMSAGLRISVSPSQPINRFKPVRIRVEFSKTGRLKYLSHLELMILYQRAVRRAGFPIEYSRGFHPAPEMSFGPPLGVGIAGLSEYFDMKVTPPFDLIRNRDKLNSLLPEGASARCMSAVPSNAESLNSFVTCYEYEVRGGDLSSVRLFLTEKEVFAKREKYDINLREMVEEAEIAGEDAARIVLADRGDKKVRLGEILPVVFNTPMEELTVTRTAMFGWDNGWVKPINTCKMQLVNSKI
jgi:radical SAM family uncharacterized protein/radical SAM-linked protein